MEKPDDEIREILSLNYNLDKYNEILNSNDDFYKISNLDMLDGNNYAISNILVSLNDDKLKIKYLDKIKIFNYKIKVINSILDDNLIELIAENYVGLKKYSIISCIKNDEIKEKYINEFEKNYQMSLINQLSEFNKMFYYNKLKIFEDCLEYLNSDENILEYFKYLEESLSINCDNYSREKEYINDQVDIKILKFVMNNPNNKQINKKLLEKLSPEALEEYNDYIKKIINKTKKYQIEELSKVDNDLEFTLTINVKNKNIQQNYFGFLLDTWKISRKSDDKSGMIISKKCNYNIEFLKELNYICDYLKRNNYILDSDKGIEINFLDNYLNKKEEFNRFLNIYANCEYVINCIMNNSSIKNKEVLINKNYRKYKDMLSLISIINKKNVSDDIFIDVVKELFDVNDYGLNFLGNKISYKSKNLELNYQSIQANIKVLFNIFYAAKYEYDNNEYYMNIINKELSDEDLKENFLNLLLDSENHFLYDYRFLNNNIELKKLNKPRKI